MKKKIEKLVNDVNTLTTEAKELKARMSFQYSHQVMSVDNSLLLPVKEEGKHFEKNKENIAQDKNQLLVEEMTKLKAKTSNQAEYIKSVNKKLRKNEMKIVYLATSK
jgi:hypothetical protein